MAADKDGPNVINPSTPFIDLSTGDRRSQYRDTADRRDNDNKNISNRIAHILAENGYLDEMAKRLKEYDALSKINPETKAFSNSEIEKLIGVYRKYCEKNPGHDKDPNAVTVQYIRERMEEIELDYL